MPNRPKCLTFFYKQTFITCRNTCPVIPKPTLSSHSLLCLPDLPRFSYQTAFLSFISQPPEENFFLPVPRNRDKIAHTPKIVSTMLVLEVPDAMAADTSLTASKVAATSSQERLWLAARGGSDVISWIAVMLVMR